MLSWEVSPVKMPELVTRWGKTSQSKVAVMFQSKRAYSAKLGEAVFRLDISPRLYPILALFSFDAARMEKKPKKWPGLREVKEEWPDPRVSICPQGHLFLLSWLPLPLPSRPMRQSLQAQPDSSQQCRHSGVL